MVENKRECYFNFTIDYYSVVPITKKQFTKSKSDASMHLIFRYLM